MSMLKEQVQRLESEIKSLKQENERLKQELDDSYRSSLAGILKIEQLLEDNKE
ncbi:MAG: hypothetical protein GF308_11705 [Candidatus Heimdallarchaeota archaeon]|nr:hypothetical protein [Candidatus Heimdallarchaeota archaeon]